MLIVELFVAWLPITPQYPKLFRIYVQTGRFSEALFLVLLLFVCSSCAALAHIPTLSRTKFDSNILLLKSFSKLFFINLFCKQPCETANSNALYCSKKKQPCRLLKVCYDSVLDLKISCNEQINIFEFQVETAAYMLIDQVAFVNINTISKIAVFPQVIAETTTIGNLNKYRCEYIA